MLKFKLSTPPVLAYADFSKPFVIHTDASREGLGAVLYQEHNGIERVIAYASRGLRNSERNYPAHKLEFLCLKWAVSEKKIMIICMEIIFSLHKQPFNLCPVFG